MDMSENHNSINNPLYNPGMPLDPTIMMSLLVDLMNSKPLQCVPIPHFRVEQLLAIAERHIHPVTERKILECIGSVYCLCLYFGLTTDFPKAYIFKFLSIVQTLQVEAIITIHNFFGTKNIEIPDLDSTLRKDEAIEIQYKLEIFSDSLAMAKLISRDLYSAMKIIFRVGRKGRHAPAQLSTDDRRRLMRYNECIQPYSLYYMCCFAYSHIAVVLHGDGNLNLFPGSLESFVLMLLTTTATAAKRSKKEHHDGPVEMAERFLGNSTGSSARGSAHSSGTQVATQGQGEDGTGNTRSDLVAQAMEVSANHRAAAIAANAISAGLVGPGAGEAALVSGGSLEDAKEAVKKKEEDEAKAKEAKLQAKAANAPKQPKVEFEIVMETAHNLAKFVAHVICDDRNLQETLLAHGRIAGHLEHPNVVYAQFRTSVVKQLMRRDSLAGAVSSNQLHSHSHSNHHQSPPPPPPPPQSRRQRGEQEEHQEEEGDRRSGIASLQSDARVGAHGAVSPAGAGAAGAGTGSRALMGGTNHRHSHLSHDSQSQSHSSQGGLMASPQLKRKQQKLEQLLQQNEEQSRSPLVADVVIDILAPNSHFLKGLNKPADWQLNDPSEAEDAFDETAGAARGITAAGGGGGGGKPPAAYLPSLKLNSASSSRSNAPPSASASARSLAGGAGGGGPSARRAAAAGGLLSHRNATGGPVSQRDPPESSRNGGGSEPPSTNRSMSNAGDDPLVSGRMITGRSVTGEGAGESRAVSAATASGFHRNRNNALDANYNASTYASTNVTLQNKHLLTKFKERVAEYWAVGKYFRPSFLVLDALQPGGGTMDPTTAGTGTHADGRKVAPEFYSLFPPEYRPPAPNEKHFPDVDLCKYSSENLVTPLNARPLHETCKLMESLYYHLSCYENRLPRILDPAQEVYWILNYVIEYLATRTKNGAGIHPANTAELHRLKKRYYQFKKKVHRLGSLTVTAGRSTGSMGGGGGGGGFGGNDVGSSRGSGVAAPSAVAAVVTAVAGAALRGGGGGGGGGVQRAGMTQPAAADSKSGKIKGPIGARERKKAAAGLGLQERLAAASLEATLESKMFDMQQQLREQRRREEQQRLEGLHRSSSNRKLKEVDEEEEDDDMAYLMAASPTKGEGDDADDDDDDLGHLSRPGSRLRSTSDLNTGRVRSKDVMGGFSNSNSRVPSRDGAVAAITGVAVEELVPSIVWNSPAKSIHLNHILFTAQDDDEIDDHPIKNPPSKEAALAYGLEMRQQKIDREEEKRNFEQYMADSQEQLMERSRVMKSALLKEMREEAKEDLQNKKRFKEEWLVQQRREAQMIRARAKIEEKEREESALREIMRVKEIKRQQEEEKRRNQIEQEEALRIEKAKIDMMVSQNEASEIARRNREEDRMRYLEERRKVVEDRYYAEIEKKTNRMARAQKRTADLRDHVQARVRMGNFKWLNGKMQFYDTVRATAVEWVQYEDENGTPYYYDPVTKSTQYREPVDADFHHYTVDERREYDAIHGEGAYDAYKADIAFKDGVNRDGGYFDEMGAWIPMYGYYDENYEWVQNEGYYDENGKFVKFAKISGDLSFMV